MGINVNKLKAFIFAVFFLTLSSCSNPTEESGSVAVLLDSSSASRTVLESGCEEYSVKIRLERETVRVQNFLSDSSITIDSLAAGNYTVCVTGLNSQEKFFYGKSSALVEDGKTTPVEIQLEEIPLAFIELFENDIPDFLSSKIEKWNATFYCRQTGETFEEEYKFKEDENLLKVKSFLEPEFDWDLNICGVDSEGNELMKGSATKCFFVKDDSAPFVFEAKPSVDDDKISSIEWKIKFEDKNGNEVSLLQEGVRYKLSALPLSAGEEEWISSAVNANLSIECSNTSYECSANSIIVNDSSSQGFDCVLKIMYGENELALISVSKDGHL